jgi:peroxiredoxin Q/BCP
MAAKKANAKKTKHTKKTKVKSIKKSAKKSAKKAPTKSLKKATKSVAKKKPTRTKAKKVTPKTAGASKPKKAGAMPVVGHMAPDFALQSDVNGMISLSRYRGKNVVLYFYPKDDTPGCTREACSFQEHKPKLIGENAVVIGVSPDGPESHKKFRAKYGLDFVLVSDEERELCKAYGVWVEKNNYGKKYMGVQRATFLIDGQGRVAYVWPKVAVDGHTEAVLAELARLN